MPDFTKGKWIYDAKKGCITADGYTIITVCYPQTPEAQIVGRLIESAPEIYGLLKQCMNKLHSFDDTYRLIECLMNHIDGKAANHEE